MRHTRSHTNNRRSHHALDGVKSVKDKDSGKLRLPHRVDESTGQYRGKQIFTPKVKTKQVHAKAVKLAEEAHDHAHDHEHAGHEHANAELKNQKGGRGKAEGRPRSRSGMGGQAS
jgi:large subunit ribosomal protein L32